MIRKAFALLALLTGVLALSLTTNPAGAQEYSGCVITVTPSTFAPGDEVQVSGSGLQPNITVDIEINPVIGTVTTDATGAFTTTVTIPADLPPGEHTISVPCDDTGAVLSETIVNVQPGGTQPTAPTTPTSQATGPGGTGRIPTTGSEVEPLLVAAGIALVAGTAFVVAARRRRSTAAV